MRKKASIFVLATVALLYGLSYTYDYLIRKNDFNKVWWLGQIENKNFDFVFLGNSRVYTMLQTDIIEKSWDQKGLNISLDGANLAQQYLMLHSFLKNNNRTKKLYFNIDFTELAMQQNSDMRVWCFLPYLNDDEICSTLKENYGNKMLAWKYIPFYKYMEFNSKIGLLTVANSIFHIEKKPFNDHGDFLNTPNRKFNLKDTFANKIIEPKNINLIYFEKILHLCKEKNIESHLYTAPVNTIISRTWVNRKDIIDKYILPVASKYGADYIDYTELPLSSNPDLFADVTHLNAEGRSQWMKFVEKFVH